MVMSLTATVGCAGENLIDERPMDKNDVVGEDGQRRVHVNYEVANVPPGEIEVVKFVAAGDIEIALFSDQPDLNAALQVQSPVTLYNADDHPSVEFSVERQTSVSVVVHNLGDVPFTGWIEVFSPRLPSTSHPKCLDREVGASWCSDDASTTHSCEINHLGDYVIHSEWNCERELGLSCEETPRGALCLCPDPELRNQCVGNFAILCVDQQPIKWMDCRKAEDWPADHPFGRRFRSICRLAGCL